MSTKITIVAGFVVALAAALGGCASMQAPVAKAGSSYVNAEYGFAMSPLGPLEGSAVAPGGMTVVFSAPPQNGFAANINVMVQPGQTTLEDYTKLSLAGFEKMRLKLNSQSKLTVSGRDALLMDYEGSMQGRELRWLGLAVIDEQRVLLVTGTALKANFPSYEKEFRRCFSTFSLEHNAAAK